MSDFLEINKHYLSIFRFKTAYNWLLISLILLWIALFIDWFISSNAKIKINVS